MAEETNEEAVESKFIDSRTTTKLIECPIPDAELIELGDEIAEKLMRKAELNGEIKRYTTGRKAEIKGIDEELEPLAEKFHNKAEFKETDCKMVCDFEAGTVTYYDMDGEEISSEDMPPEGYQREFATIMDMEIGKELVEKAEEAISELLDDQDDDDPEDIVSLDDLIANVAQELDIPNGMAARLVTHIRANSNLRGHGTPVAPFVILKGSEVEESANATSDPTEDDILDAVKTVNELQRASTASLQRKLGVGYNRAAKLMEILKDRGVIGEITATGLPEILKDVGLYLEEFEVTEPPEDEEPEGDDE